MMKLQKKSAIPTDKTDRRRGRPAGKNRTPLSLEERRARNAQYERERRNETADAMAKLAEAACCDPQICNAELLATVISQLQRRAKRKLPQDIENLKRVNQNLESQIAALQSRLGYDVDINTDDEDSNDNDSEHDSATTETQEPEEHEQSESRSRKSTRIATTQDIRRPKKIRKTLKSSSIHKTSSTTESDTESDTDSTNSNWSESEVSHKPRKRSQKVSEQSQDTVSTYIYKTESESSQHGTRSPKYYEDSNQSGTLEESMEMNIPSLSLPEIQEATEDYGADEKTENELFGSFTEGEKRIINEWIDCSAGLDEGTEHSVDNRVRKFLEFDDFMLDINA